MVRFYWHVDDGCSAHVPANGVTLASSEPTRLAVEMDVPGVAGSAVGMLTIPPCTAEGKSPPLRPIGIVIAHDVDAASWQGPLLTSIAQCLAKRGFIVMRNYCNLKELRRLRMFEKALDTVSKSPYATSAGVDSWLLVGMGNGARVAATVSSKAKANIAGLAVVSYPLHESTPPAGKGAGFPDSTSQLMKCSAPILVLQGELDSRCSVASMSAFLRQIRPQQPGPRFGILPAVNESLLGSDDAILNARTLVCKALLEFAEGLPVVSGADVDLPGIPSVHNEACLLPPPPPLCVSELGIILDLPLRQEAPADMLGHAAGMPESFPVQSNSPNQLLTPRGVGAQLLSAHPPLPAGGVAYAQHGVGVDSQHAQHVVPAQHVGGVDSQHAQHVVPAQHVVGVDSQHAQQVLTMQSQNVMGILPQGAVGVDGPLPFVAPLPLGVGQLGSLPATLVGPAAVLNENTVAGAKPPAMPLFRADEGQMQSPDYLMQPSESH